MQIWLTLPGTGWWRGEGGVRAGWRVMLYAVLLVALLAGEVWFLVHLQPPWLKPAEELNAGFIAINEVLLLLPVLAATAIMANLEGRSLLSCGLDGPRRWRPLAGGLLAGVASLSLLIVVLLATGHAEASWHGLPLQEAVASGVSWLGACLLLGPAEEIAFRGYPQQILSSGIGFWTAALLTSLAFASAHISNPHESVIGILNIFGAGMILCLGLRRTGALWWPIGFHAGWDFSENFLYGTHDSGQFCAGALMDTLPHGALLLSGGLAGPEGSIFGLGVELLAAAAILLLVRQRPRGF